MLATIKEGLHPGCIGRIVQLHAEYYADSNGFGVAFEAKVARELADFCQNYKFGRDGIWLIECDARIEGSVVIDGSKAENDGAHLRWFITSDAVKNQGVGKRMLQEAMMFVDSCSYKKTYLWTFSGLNAARHLYESCGFKLVHESPGNQWGSVVIEQKFLRGVA